MPFKSDFNDNIPPESQYKSYIQDGLANRRIVNRNILLINDQNEDRILTERAPVAIDQQDNVFFRDLINYLREQNLIQPGSSIFFYDEQRKVFVHQGTDPITLNTMIPLQKFNSDQITIKYRPMQQSQYHMNNACEQNQSYRNNQQYPSNMAQNNASRDFFSTKQRYMFEGNANTNYQNNSAQNYNQNIQTTSCNSSATNNKQNIIGVTDEEEEANFDVSTKSIPREKRVKERKIGYVYERVMEWRRYYEQGVQNEQGRLVKVNLDVAASMVGLSRKTLDDYYKYIRKAEGYNFDFKGRSDEKIGVLRNFVRDRQKRSNKNEEEDVQVDDDNREQYSKEEIMSTTMNSLNHTTKTTSQEDNEHSRQYIQTQHESQNRNVIHPPPPYIQEEENNYYQRQNYQQDSQNIQMRIRQTAPEQQFNGYSEREETCVQDYRYQMQQQQQQQYNPHNSSFDEEGFIHNTGADASAQNQYMDIEKFQYMNQNYNYDNQGNNCSFDMNNECHYNSKFSNPAMNNSFNDIQNANQQYCNRSFDNINNGASPNENDYDQEYNNFLNDEGMPVFQED